MSNRRNILYTGGALSVLRLLRAGLNTSDCTRDAVLCEVLSSPQEHVMEAKSVRLMRLQPLHFFWRNLHLVVSMCRASSLWHRTIVKKR